MGAFQTVLSDEGIEYMKNNLLNDVDEFEHRVVSGGLEDKAHLEGNEERYLRVFESFCCILSHHIFPSIMS